MVFDAVGVTGLLSGPLSCVPPASRAVLGGPLKQRCGPGAVRLSRLRPVRIWAVQSASRLHPLHIWVLGWPSYWRAVRSWALPGPFGLRAARIWAPRWRSRLRLVRIWAPRVPSRLLELQEHSSWLGCVCLRAMTAQLFENMLG